MPTGMIMAQLSWEGPITTHLAPRPILQNRSHAQHHQQGQEPSFPICIEIISADELKYLTQYECYINSCYTILSGEIRRKSEYMFSRSEFCSYWVFIHIWIIYADSTDADCQLRLITIPRECFPNLQWNGNSLWTACYPEWQAHEQRTWSSALPNG